MRENNLVRNSVRNLATAGGPLAGAAPLQVRRLSDDGDQARRWDAFVTACPEGTFFHLAAWRTVIRQVFGHAMYYLYAEADGAVQGVLPLGHIKSRVFGHSLVSTPFLMQGGCAADTAEARQALTDEACRLAQDLGVDYLELRNPVRRHPDWPVKDDLYVNFRKTLDPDPEVNLKAIPRKQRAMVRKGIQAGLVGEPDDGIHRLYDCYTESLRNLGTPAFPRRWFQAIKSAFGDHCRILTITHEGQAVASVMSFYFRDQVLPYYGGGRDDARRFKANDFMYWELMRRSCQEGIRVFDYGRSKVGTGSYHFKKNWGFEPEPLSYEFHLVKARAVPNVSPTNPKYRLFIDTWKRLPLPVSRLLGPFVVRNLG